MGNNRALPILLAFSLFLTVDTILVYSHILTTSGMLSSNNTNLSQAVALTGGRMVKAWSGSQLLIVPQHEVSATANGNVVGSGRGYAHASPLIIKSQSDQQVAGPLAGQSAPSANWDEQ